MVRINKLVVKRKMKKIYISLLTIITLLLITSTYASAGISLLSNDSDISGDSEVNSELSESNNGGPQISDNSISSGNNAESNLNSELSTELLPEVKIVSIEPNPTYIKIKTKFSGFISNPQNDTILYQWDFGDGKIYQGMGSSNPIDCKITHIYSKSGTFTVKLQILKKETPDIVHSLKTQDNLMTMVVRKNTTKDELRALYVSNLDYGSDAGGGNFLNNDARFLLVAPQKILHKK